MSKIGRRAIDITGVQVDVKGRDIHYKGAKASGVYTLPEYFQAKLDGDKLTILVTDAFVGKRFINRDWGLHRALIANKIAGAARGFQRELKINGLGISMNYMIIIL